MCCEVKQHPESMHGGDDVQVVAPAKEVCRVCPGTQVLLQPAAGDAHHLPVHPQPAFVGASLSPVESVPAPAHVRCGASLISITSAGVFADLGASESGKLVLRLPTDLNHILVTISIIVITVTILAHLKPGTTRTYRLDTCVRQEAGVSYVSVCCFSQHSGTCEGLWIWCPWLGLCS